MSASTPGCRATDSPGWARGAAWAALALVTAMAAGCDESTGPFEGNPFTVSWTRTETGRASLVYGRSDRLASRVAYETVTHPGSTHVLRPLDVVEGRTYRGQWRLHRDDGTVLEEPPFLFRPGKIPPRPRLFSFTMIDVGWGDAHLLRTPDGANVLIDAGRPDHAADVVTLLRNRIPEGESLTGLVLSHPDCDHVGGFVGTLADSTDGVLENFTVDWALESFDTEGSDSLYGRYRDLLSDQGAAVFEAPDGLGSDTEATLRWDDDLGVRVLNSGNHIGDGLANNGSLVLQLRIGGVTILTGGDALIPVEQRLLDLYGDGVRSHVLKVHHHGNSDASLGDFIDAVRPFAALVPIAREEVLIMPSNGVLERLRATGADIFRSDEIELMNRSGGFHVTAWTDGLSLEIEWTSSGTQHSEPRLDCRP